MNDLELLSCQNSICLLDLGVSVDTGATNNYRNTDESTAVKLFVSSIGMSVTIVIDCK